MEQEPFRIGIAGLGTVGSSVIKLLVDHSAIISSEAGRKIVVSAVSARNKNKTRDFSMDSLPWKVKWYENPVSMVRDCPLDAVVELIGGKDGIALEVMTEALENNLHIVTANKALLAESGEIVWKKAREKRKLIAFEAAVAGGIPIINALRDSLAANNVYKVQGIINGTCNLILTQMYENNKNFEEVLKEAQEQGFAEAQPHSDIEGLDSAHKIALISRIVFGKAIPFQQIYIQGISQITQKDMNYAKQINHNIKLICEANRHEGHLSISVFPALIPKHHLLASVGGVTNCVCVSASPVGLLSFIGDGAGGAPTSSAVVADIINLARHNPQNQIFLHHTTSCPPTNLTPRGDYHGKFYLRLKVPDTPGVLAKIAEVLAQNDISVASMFQHGSKSEFVDLVFITHLSYQNKIDNAIDKLKTLNSPSSSSPLTINAQTLRILS